jgi:hypothetical protein
MLEKTGNICYIRIKSSHTGDSIMGRHAGILPDGTRLEGREGIERRRAFVMQSRLQGLRVEAIARVLNVHRNTITNDIRAISKQRAEYVRGLDADASIGETIEFYDHIRDRAMLGYGEAETSMGKVAFLQAALKAAETKNKLLMDAGVIPKAGRAGSASNEVSINLDGDKIDAEAIGKMSNQELLEAQKKLRDKITMWKPSKS